MKRGGGRGKRRVRAKRGDWRSRGCVWANGGI